MYHLEIIILIKNSNITKEDKHSEYKSIQYIPDFNFEIIKTNKNSNIEEIKIERIIVNLKNEIIQLNERHFILNTTKLLKDNINFTKIIAIYEKKNIKIITIYPIEFNKNKLKKKYNLIKNNKNFDNSKYKFPNSITLKLDSILLIRVRYNKRKKIMILIYFVIQIQYQGTLLKLKYYELLRLKQQKKKQ